MTIAKIRSIRLVLPKKVSLNLDYFYPTPPGIVVQGVPENLTHFVFELLHLKIVSISYAKPLILTLTHRGKQAQN